MPLKDGKFTPIELPDKHAHVLLNKSQPWRYRSLHGGRNGAKDWSVSGVVIERAIRQPIRVLWTREIQKTIKDSVYQLNVDTIKRLGYEQYYKIGSTEIKGTNGAAFMYSGLRDLSVEQLKSIEGVDLCVVGEAQNLTEKSWNVLNPTIRKPGSEIWLVYNDHSKKSFIHRLVVTNPPANMISAHVNWTDVPREWISQVIYDQATTMREENELLYNRIWGGEPGEGGQFFPEFGSHLRVQPFNIQPHQCNLYGSLDYGDGQGENASATSFGLWHIDPDKRPHRLFTYYKRHQNAATYAREIHAMIRAFPHTQGTMPKRILADPSMFIKVRHDDNFSKSVADIFADHGLTLTPANNDRVNGWRVMRNYFGLDSTGVPRSFYWAGYNDEYENFIPTLEQKETNPDDCIKGGEDHVADEARYFFVDAMGVNSSSAAVKEERDRKVVSRIELIQRLNENVVCRETGY